MGKKSCFSAVKKVLSPDSKEKKDQLTNKNSSKSKKKWFGKSRHAGQIFLPEKEEALPVSTPLTRIEDAKLIEAENEQSKHAYSVAHATAVAAEAAVAAAQAAAEVVRLTSVSRITGRSSDELAAIRIQAAFRGYMTRRAFRALKGLVRLKTLIQGQSVQRQGVTTLKCMHKLSRLQSQIRARRIRMSEENQALQRQLQQKREKELEKSQTSVNRVADWNHSPGSKEHLEKKILSKQEASIRRERALAYAYSHQQMWKNDSTSANPTFMDPNNPHWGWSWLERWMAARPWENRSTTYNNDHASVRTGATSHAPSVGEISISSSLCEKPSPAGKKSSRPPSRRQSSPAAPSKAPSSSSTAGKTKPPSPKGNSSIWSDDESRNAFSILSERHRRHSIGGSSVRDDESFASSPAFPSYMTPTQSAKAKSIMSSSMRSEKNATPDKASVSTAKKRLSFPSSPAGSRRHSLPPEIDISPVENIAIMTGDKATDRGNRYC